MKQIELKNVVIEKTKNHIVIRCTDNEDTTKLNRFFMDYMCYVVGAEWDFKQRQIEIKTLGK